jgi:DNA sulfur modification protein DndD
MILDTLIPYNFGIYKDRQEIALTPKSPKKPIILFGGLNGSGKTTLLDALKLVLHGKLADCSTRGGLPYEDFLRRSIHRTADPNEGASVTLVFRHRRQGEEKTYRVTRSWRATPRTVREHVEVQVGGQKDAVLTEHWAEHVESFIPARLARFFFFDGEKIETLAELENASAVLSTALQSLLGLDLVEQLQTDLKVIIRRRRKEQHSAAERADLEEAEVELREMEDRCLKAAQNRASIQNQVDGRSKRVRELEEQFRQSGGELFLKRSQLETEHRTLESKLASARERLQELAHGAAPLLLVRDLLDAVAAQAASPITRLNEHLLTILYERDSHLLTEARRAGTAPDVVARLDAFLRQDREQRRPLRPSSSALSLTDEGYQVLEGLRGSLLAETQATAGLLLSEVTSLRQDIEQVERQLAMVPDEEAVKELSRKLDKSRQEHARTEAALQVAEETYHVLQQELIRKRQAHAKRLEETFDQEFEKKEASRIIEHAQGVTTLMEKFRTQVIERHLRRIEELILQGFSHLVRKESLVSRLTIDPATYHLNLLDRDGEPLPHERLSAGERQLLAISIIWGLARAAGRPLPIIIDTPLGRLDSMHRKHLIERYFPVASHQVLLLSTDEEIDEGGLDKLRPAVGYTYRMIFDERQGYSRIEKDYFW